jgi:arylformamidase
MTAEYVFLSHPLSTDTPTPPAIPRIELSPLLSLDRGDSANVTFLKMATHTGTHVDAPSHVVPGGTTLSDFRADELVFERPTIFDLPLGDGILVMPSHLKDATRGHSEADLVIFRFGYGKVRASDPSRFSAQCPGFGVESAEFLLSEFPRMRALGMDVPSLSCIRYLDTTMKAHDVLLGGKGRRFIVIEDMHLDQDLGGLEQVIVAPLRLRGSDGGPATILGRRVSA